MQPFLLQTTSVPCPLPLLSPTTQRALCTTGTFFFKLNTHSVTALCQKLRILTAELAGETMPVPGHAFTTQLLRGNPLSSMLSWTPNRRWEGPKRFFPLCLLCGGDSQGKEGWTCQPEQGFQNLRANPRSYKHKQFHFILLGNNRLSALFKQTTAAFAQHHAPRIRDDLSPKASHFQPAVFKFHPLLPLLSQWTISSCLQRPTEDDISTHKTGKKCIQHIFWVTYASTLTNTSMNWTVWC